jgi:hypothetical protein
MVDSEKSKSLKSSIAGAIIGSLVTAIAAAAVAFLGGFWTNISDASLRKLAELVFNRFEVHLRLGTTQNNSDFSSECLKDEIVVGGACKVTTGDGTIQNVGIFSAKTFGCTYSRRSDPTVKVEVTAACLALKQ